MRILKDLAFMATAPIPILFVFRNCLTFILWFILLFPSFESLLESFLEEAETPGAFVVEDIPALENLP